jgi:muconolactone delta-isomerase
VNVQTISGDAEGQARTTLSASPEMTKESIDSAAENLDSREQNLSGRMKSSGVWKQRWAVDGER